jgi:hypothetical protein
VALIRERYADFGPTFAHQKLTEEHALCPGRNGPAAAIRRGCAAPENRWLRGATALLSEAEDGILTVRANGRVLASTLYPKDHARLAFGKVVDHKRLDGVFAWIAAQQHERDAAGLANPKITLRDQKRIRAAAPLSRLTSPTMLAKADITTLARSGHSYFVLTSRHAPLPPPGLRR